MKPKPSSKSQFAATITENGNGLPNLGEHVYDQTTDTVYVVRSWDGSDRISTHGGGRGNSVDVIVEPVGSASDLTEEQWEAIQDNNYGICVGSENEN